MAASRQNGQKRPFCFIFPKCRQPRILALFPFVSGLLGHYSSPPFQFVHQWGCPESLGTPFPPRGAAGANATNRNQLTGSMSGSGAPGWVGGLPEALRAPSLAHKLRGMGSNGAPTGQKGRRHRKKWSDRPKRLKPNIFRIWRQARIVSFLSQLHPFGALFRKGRVSID